MSSKFKKIRKKFFMTSHFGTLWPRFDMFPVEALGRRAVASHHNEAPSNRFLLLSIGKDHYLNLLHLSNYTICKVIFACKVEIKTLLLLLLQCNITVKIIAKQKEKKNTNSFLF